MYRIATLIHLASYVLAIQAAPVSDAFPVVDLGYARHAPTKINYTTTNNISYATYANIRFAQPPLGDLRFRAPQTPPPPSPGIQDGMVPFNSTNCLQAVPDYFDIPGVSGVSWGSEDCLFLDVIVPDGVRAGDNVPVLHWIYGGGYFYGAKDNGGNPAALFNDMTPDQKFVIVASNYRLGALGWMATDEEPSMFPNAGLYDCLTALEWTRDNIHRFGGDRNSVSVMGQSAGAGVIEFMLAANSLGHAVPFNQAIMSSPASRPHVNRSTEYTDLYHAFRNQTNCTTLACLRSLPTEALAVANTYLYLKAPTHGFPGPSISYGPILDNILAKDVPMRTFSNNTANPSTGYVQRIISGNLKEEGAASTVGNFTSWQDQLSIFARTPSNSTIQTVTSLYGAFNGSTAASFLPNGTVNETPFDQFNGDIIYRCHGALAAKFYSASGPQNQYWRSRSPLNVSSYRYDMSIPPALHGGDLNYYFYDPVIAAVAPDTNATIARKFQRYLRRFILGQDLEDWPEYSSTGLASPAWMDISLAGFRAESGGREAVRLERCPSIVGLFSDAADGW